MKQFWKSSGVFDKSQAFDSRLWITSTVVDERTCASSGTQFRGLVFLILDQEVIGTMKFVETVG